MDLELQTLERRWRQTGAADDEARWLSARVRAGELSRERLLFAADLGHAPALLALDRPVDPTEAVEFLRAADPAQRALGRLGREGLVRVGLAVVQAHSELVVRHHGPVHAGVAPALGAVRAWCARPGEVQAEAVRHLARPLPQGLSRPRHNVVLLVARLAEAVTAPLPQAGRSVELVLRIAMDPGAVLEAPRAPAPASLVEDLGVTGAESPRMALRSAYERRLLARVQADVVPWALEGGP